MGKKATGQGNAKAPALRGTLEKAAAAQYKKAIAGDAKAACKVGDAYFRGNGAEQSSSAARDWYRYAAELGNVDAMANLIMFLEKGEAARREPRPADEPEMEIDLEAALTWARRAHAETGDEENTIAYLEKLVAKGGAKKSPLTKAKAHDVAGQRAAIAAKIEASGLGKAAASIRSSLRESLRLAPDAGSERVGGSRLGGTPDLPADVPWPDGPTHPLSFIGQLDLATLAPLDATKTLPTAGLLSFFWDAHGNAWGHDERERNRFAVIFTAAGAKLAARPKPKKLVGPHKYTKVEFAPIAVRPVVEVTLPFVRTEEVRGWKLNEKQTTTYWDDVYGQCDAIWPTGAGPYHRVLGHPDAVQGDMGRRMSYGLAGKADAIDKAPIAALDADAKTWVLLLQVDTDEKLGTNWGEGRLYFWIRSADLAAKRFDRAWFQFQS